METQRTEEEKIIHNFFTPEGRVKALPAQQKKQLVVLAKLAESFNLGQVYTEKEVNDILRRFNDDFVMLRRALVDFHFLTRANGIYQKVQPDS